MKKIINGRKYDTDTAVAVASYFSGSSYRDFNYVEETLYKKRTGEFFLYGEGGAMSRYSVSCGDNSWCGGEAIILMSEMAARAWVEAHCTGDEYEKIFGEVEE